MQTFLNWFLMWSVLRGHLTYPVHGGLSKWTILIGLLTFPVLRGLFSERRLGEVLPNGRRPNSPPNVTCC